MLLLCSHVASVAVDAERGTRMAGQKPRNRWIGFVVGVGSFIFPLGPYWLLSFMGDRPCDSLEGTTCRFDRWTQDRIDLAIIVVICALLGLLAHWLANRRRRVKPSLSAFD